MLRHPLLDALGLRHGFGLRGVPIDPRVVRPRQVHGAAVAVVADGHPRPAEADAILGRDPGCPVGVVTADCVPVLAASGDGRTVAAIHAGWRGLAAGVVERGIEALRDAARVPDLVAVVGPHIGVCCYEVDEPVLACLRERFAAAVDAAIVPAGRDRPGHWLLDLGNLVHVALDRSGVDRQHRGSVQDACTFCNSAHFHSYRRDGARAGRLLHQIRPRRGA